MCFNLVKTSSEINHSSYSLKVACYLCLIFGRNIIYNVLACELISPYITFKVHSQRQCLLRNSIFILPHVRGAFPLVPIYVLNKYLLNECKYVAFSLSFEHHSLAFSL